MDRLAAARVRKGRGGSRAYLTPDNHRQLLAEAAGKTKLQVLELIARRFPRKDVASTIRKLPAPRDVPASRALAVTEESTPRQPDLGQATRPSPSSTTDVTSEPPSVQVSKTTPARNAVVEPLSAASYAILLNASPQLKAKLEQARDLLSHSNPGGDLAAVIERALDLLLERTLKQRFAQTKRPRPSRSANRKIGSNAEVNPGLVHGDRGPGTETIAPLIFESCARATIVCSLSRTLAGSSPPNRIQHRRVSPGASQAGPPELVPRKQSRG